MASPEPAAPRRVRRLARWPFVLALLVGLLAAAVLLTDRVLLDQAERTVATRLQADLGTPATPDVQIDGSPFLTQVIAGRFGSVRVGADDVPASGERFAADRLDLHLRDVRATDGYQTLTAAEVDGTAVLAYGVVQQLVGQPVSYSGDGRVRIAAPSQVGGVTIDAAVVATLTVDVADQTVGLADPEVIVNGQQLPEVASDALVSALIRPTPITGVPFGLQVTSLTAREDGVLSGVVGTDVQIQR